MKAEELTAIQRRLDAATRGPWQVLRSGSPGEYYYFIEASHGDYQIFDGDGASREDAEFTAHAKEDIEKLLAHVTLLRSTVALLERDIVLGAANAAEREKQVRAEAAAYQRHCEREARAEVEPPKESER